MIQGFNLVTYQNVREGLLKYREQGALRGKYLGFPVLHEHYTMSLPGVTDWTGFSQSGKSEVLLELLLNTSEYYGWKHLLYVPDVGEKNEVLAILIHKISGKTFDKRYPNFINESDVEKHLQWILQHFFILHKDDVKAKITPYEFWDYAVELKKELVGGIQTATIDSWKDMKHNGHSFGRDDQYLEDVLSYRNALSEANNIHFHTIIHPTRTDKDSSGKRKPPTMYDLKGGTEWANSGKVMITVHRQDGTQNGVDIIINKAKPKSVAKQGTVSMFFDASIARFFWQYEGNKTYATKNNFETSASKIDFDNDIPF